MARLRHFWALAAVTAGSLGIGLSLLLGGALGTAAATGAAPAAVAHTSSVGESAADIFGCRASVARAVLAGNVLAEPAVANSATTPCADASQAVQSTGLLGSSSLLSLGSVGPAGVQTYETGSLGGSTSPAATAVADVQALSLSLGGYTLSVAGPLEAQTAVECTGTSLTAQASSNLDALTISGPGLPSGGESLEVGGALNQVLGNLPAALSVLISVTANEQILTSTSVTERMLDIKLLASNVQIVVGEASVSVPDPTVCANNVPPGTTTTGTTGTGTVTTITGANGAVTTVTTAPGTSVIEPAGAVPSTLEECAPNSYLDTTTGECVINGANGQVIFVSQPFEGPSGGTVITLAQAKAKYSSPCLSGAGPNWVLVATGNGVKVIGTPNGDRILGLGAKETISGLAGDDCIDDTGGTSNVTDGNGKDRIYVTKGTNRVIGGNGNNVIHGGNGKDWITDGTGNDYIYAGKLANRIDAYGNRKHIFGGPSNDRIWTNSIVATVSCGGGKGNILFARKKVAAYGAKHGCQKVHVLR